jgi:general secretion pathway protein E
MGIRRTAIDETLRSLGRDGQVLEEVQQNAQRLNVPLRDALTRMEGVDTHAVARALSHLSGLPVLEVVDVDLVQPELIRPLPMGLARDRGVLPLYVADGQLVVGLVDLGGMAALDDLRVLLGYPVRPVIVPSDVLRDAQNKAYDKAAATAQSVLEDVEKKDDEDLGEGDLNLEDADLLDDPNEAPIIRFVNALLMQSLKERASDIHIEPFEKDFVCRFRIDGELYERVKPPPKLKNSIVSRIKIMAGLNIAEKRLPQDGRIRRRMAGREVDLRVSTLPVRHGERVVMRILEKGEVFSLEKTGMNEEMLAMFRKLIRLPHGILLVSGPTGSGKSTTLYSAISEINEPNLNILTIEDPVEYELRGVGQVQVNPKIDLTFASALRSFLRQDPDVILVGEIRDRETAANAVQASLTGHLVFSTIHTNDAAGAFARLTEMGVEPFLVASSLVGVLAQRLVRRLCPDCREPYVPSDAELADLGLRREQAPRAFRASGKVNGQVCPACNGLGYRGRTGIYEFLTAHDDVKSLVMRNADAGAIKRKAIEVGMKTLREDGIEKALKGITSFDEIVLATRDDGVVE